MGRSSSRRAVPASACRNRRHGPPISPNCECYVRKRATIRCIVQDMFCFCRFEGKRICCALRRANRAVVALMAEAALSRHPLPERMLCGRLDLPAASSGSSACEGEPGAAGLLELCLHHQPAGEAEKSLDRAGKGKSVASSGGLAVIHQLSYYKLFTGEVRLPCRLLRKATGAVP